MKPLRFGFASLAALIAVGFTATVAVADASPNWHVYNLVPSGRTLTSPVAPGQGSDLATFDFLNTPATSYLLTSHGDPTVVGDIRGRTVSATFSVDKSLGASFFYDTSGGNTCGGPANTRLFFQTSNEGGFAETHFWWSNPVSMNLDTVIGRVTISTTVNGQNWSDFFGHFGNDPAHPGFDDAASNTTYIGLSYGGGCFFANGVGVENGSATLHLIDFSVT